jgi:hypothetical protein
MKPYLKIALVGLLLLGLAACAAGTGDSSHAAEGGPIAKLVLGFWHGLIAPITLIVEVVDAFFPHVLPWTFHLYETKAAGVFYDIGFYLGLAGGPTVVYHRTVYRRVAV